MKTKSKIKGDSWLNLGIMFVSTIFVGLGANRLLADEYNAPSLLIGGALFMGSYLYTCYKLLQ